MPELGFSSLKGGGAPPGTLSHNKAYIGTVYYNPREALDGNGPGDARNRTTRHPDRPREERIAIARAGDHRPRYV
jgi:hypothetical protein